MTRGLAAISAASVALMLLHAGGSFYGVDDFLNLGLARQMGLNWDFLKLGIYQHFAPGHRFLDWTIMRWTHLGWWLALTYSAIGLVAGVAAFGILVRDVTASKRLALGAAAFFGISVAWIRVVQWWANAAHVVPSLVGVLVTLIGVVRYRRDRSRAALALCAAGYAGGLLFYSKTLLALVYALLLLYVALPSAPARLRELPAAARRDLPVLAILGLLTAGYVVILKTGHYDEGSVLAPLSTWTTYARIVWLRNLAPLTLNSAIPERTSGLDEALVVLAEVALLGAVVATVWRNRQAWRPWVFLLVSLAASAVLIGYGRLNQFGASIGYDLRYTAEATFLLPLAFVLAWALPAQRALPVPRIPARAGWAAGAVAAIVLVVLGLRSGGELADAWQGPAVRDYIKRLDATAAARTADGPATVLEDAVPPIVAGEFVVPFNRLSNIVPLATDRIGVDQPTGTPMVVEGDGTVRPWKPGATKSVAAGTAMRRHRLVAMPGAKPVAQGRRACLDTRTGPAAVDLDTKKLLPLDSRPHAIDIGLERVRVGAKILLTFDHGAGFQGLSDRTLGFVAGQRAVRTSVPPDVVQVRIEMAAPGVGCLGRITLTSYR
jgi:hypothetical protein